MTERLTSKRVEGDFYQLLRDSELAAGLSGSVYRSGTRPRDSRKEDAVVQFVTGLAGQIPTGVVQVSIYFNDIAPYANGVYMEDGKRAEEIETAAQQWVNSLTAAKTNYLVELSQSISTQEADDAARQHFVAVRLQYRYCDMGS